jgi:arsenical pump membrane protein
LPTAIAGALTAVVVLIRSRTTPWTIVKDISWGVLPLVAGLFVLVQALDKTGLIDVISRPIRGDAADALTAWAVGAVVAIAANLMNNLPAGLVAGSAVQTANASDEITRAILIGVNLGPNLSVTGSLATILWLAALRREGQGIGPLRFLKLGFLLMPPALLLALGGALLFR